jgi:hypothetical protein
MQQAHDQTEKQQHNQQQPYQKTRSHAQQELSFAPGTCYNFPNHNRMRCSVLKANAIAECWH